mgnify:CR=1 FL=1
MPTDYTKTTFQTFMVDYDFLIVIEPCNIDTYTANPVAADIAYDLGSPGLLNVSSYAFK